MENRVFSGTIIKRFRYHLEKRFSKYITYPKFIFLCGKSYSYDTYYKSNRGIISNFIKSQKQDVVLVLSEKLWEKDYSKNMDLLTFEEFLAEVSDCIILFVESPGTFCELGAFSYADKLFSDKLVVIIDNKYKNEQSFIVRGPVEKCRSNGSEIIFANLETGDLLSSGELRLSVTKILDRLNDNKHHLNKRITNFNSEKVYINSFIIEILELIKLSQPIKSTQLWDLYKLVKEFRSFTFIKRDGNPFSKEINPSHILKLLYNSDLIDIDMDEYITYKSNKIEHLLFNYTEFSEDSDRNRLICRKYHFGEKVQ